MQQLLNFFFKNRTFLLFLMLFSFSLGLTIASHDYHRSKFINSSKLMSGSVHAFFSKIGNYFNLKEENTILLQENNRLKALILNHPIESKSVSNQAENYKLTPALVIKNTYAFPQNYLTLDKGERDLIKEDMGVITSKGLVGIIDKTSSKYARVISILNIKSKINAKLKKSNHFGTLEWNGKNHRLVQLHDIQDLVKLVKGDTVVTSGFSSVFPENIPIGRIESFQLNDTKDLYIINVVLFNDMTNLRHVHIIENLDLEQLKILKRKNE
ncbi:MAG: rod shape-determining protein MreC [Flavobacteriaceae bacterium]|nr:rod shape-determining protein MreC [Flavobacteriaceae bacterium]|tara:strand:- start:7058 stop:7864 length:807 start_codon:yes stop_codon:yes gene_type:complete